MRSRKPAPSTVTFSCEPEWHGALLDPVPAAKILPGWLKKLAPEIPTNDIPALSVKTCMPVLDAYQAGYMMLLPSPVHFRVNGDQISSTWRSGDMKMVDNHTPEQVAGSNWPLPALKWINPWIIRTSPEFSCIITHPFNRPELPFTTLTGVVDTDTYPTQINFPFVWTGDRPYDDVIPAGTPIAQVIPFRREEMQMNVEPLTEAGGLEARKARNLMSLRNHGYRDIWRRPKHWRS